MFGVGYHGFVAEHLRELPGGVRRARFEQQHLARRVLASASGEYGPGRASADDQDVVGGVRHDRLPFSEQMSALRGVVIVATFWARSNP